MVESIIFDKNEILPCTAYLEGEYGINGVYVGVPVKLGAAGINEVIELDLDPNELSALQQSAKSVEELIKIMENAPKH